MKTPLCIALLLLTAYSLFAQPSARRDGGRSEGHRSDRFGSESDRRGAMMKHGMDRWLEQLREKNPEQYEEMARLRRENPREFYVKIREVLRAKRQEMLDQFPPVKEAIAQLNPEQREKFYGLLFHLGQRATDRRGSPEGRGPRTPENPEFVRLKHAFQNAPDEARRKQIRSELRQRLQDDWEQRMRQREAQADDIEVQLKKLRGSMREHQLNKEKLLEKRLQELIDG